MKFSCLHLFLSSSSSSKEIRFSSCLMSCLSWFDFLLRALAFNIENATWSDFCLLVFFWLEMLNLLSILHVTFWLNISNQPIHDFSFIRLVQRIYFFSIFIQSWFIIPSSRIQNEVNRISIDPGMTLCEKM